MPNSQLLNFLQQLPVDSVGIKITLELTGLYKTANFPYIDEMYSANTVLNKMEKQVDWRASEASETLSGLFN